MMRKLSVVEIFGGGLLAICFAIILVSGFHKYRDTQSAKSAGFSSVEEYRAALRQGYSTKAEVVAAEKAEKRRQRKAEAEKRKAERLKEEAACRADVMCWGERIRLKAIFACQPLIEKTARYSFRWTDGWLEPKFSKFAYSSGDTYVYWGDKLQFQNRFGAWEYQVYKCMYNAATGEVDEVIVRPGRL